MIVSINSFCRLSLLMIPLMLMACEEEGPDIRLDPPDDQQGLRDTTFQADADTAIQPKRLLVEDFTAVRCNNCPKATNVIKSLKKEYGDSVIALGIHCNLNFSRPYEESKENYRLKKGQAIYEWFEKPSQPAGMLDRHKFKGQDDVVLDYQSWESFAPKRLKEETEVNLYLGKNLSKDKKEVKVTVRSRFLKDLNEPVYLSLVVTEDNIQDVQLGPDKKRPDYVHNYVVRYIQTPSKGLKIAELPTKKQVVIKEFVIPLADKWKLEDLNIVAFTHQKEPKGPVLQAQKVPVN